MLTMFIPKIIAFSFAFIIFTSLTLPAFAADEVPPWPMLFEGTAYYDGEFVRDGLITVRVDDWESRSVNVTDGIFKCAATCLLAGPPGYNYVGQPITFHLNDEHTARLTFPFPLQGTPSISPIDLYFGDLPAALPTPTPFTLMLLPTPTPSLATGTTPNPTIYQPAPTATPSVATTTDTPDSAGSTFFTSLFFYIVVGGLCVLLLLTGYAYIRSKSRS